MATSSSQDDPILDTYHAVVLAFSDFLTVSIHTILYERDIYPQTSFLKARKYNYPVRQSRHPKVCQWIQDAVAAVEVEMLKCTIHSTSLVICSPPPSSTPLERYTFCTAAFPQIQPSEHLTPFSPSLNAPNPQFNPAASAALLPLPNPPPPTQNLPSQFRATLSRLSAILPTLTPLPPDCTFTLAIELRDRADVPIGVSVRNVQPWIVAEPKIQKEQQRAQRRRAAARGQGGGEEAAAAAAEEKDGAGEGLSSVRTTPIRSLDAGAFVMEMWVEEGKGKLEIPPKQDPSQSAQPSSSDPPTYSIPSNSPSM
ncbi:hypothetical protein MMC29_003580 [Sticta canariensis]|nr:hypothetical protein [Sticta canariensis]